MQQRRTAGGGVARWWNRRSQRRMWLAAALVTGSATLLIFLVDRSLAAPWSPVAAVIVAVLALLVNSVTRSVDGEDPRAGRIARLAQATEDLASVIGEQWRAEARVRRLQDPEPLKVRWAVAAPTIVDHWDNVVRNRVDLTPAAFSGRLDDIVEVFASVPSGRMVVLGRPGAGKSVLAIRFTLDMLARRAPGEPVPVIFPVSTWDPAHQSLHTWLTERLVADFRSLGAITSPGHTVASDLLDSRRVLPVLDGLDELTKELCEVAVRRLNAELDEDIPLLVTCRTEIYTAIAASCDVLTSTLAVELLPLSLAEAGRYLERTARLLATSDDRPSESVWGPVLRRLQQHSPDPGIAALREVLSTPLMTAMARSVYSDTGRDPAELLQENFSGSPARIEEHLLGALIPAVFDETMTGGDDQNTSAWTADQAKRWLAFLAGHLEQRKTVNLAWWELETTLPALLRRLAPGLLAGCVGAVVIGMVLSLFMRYVFINHWCSGTVVSSGGLVVGGVVGLTVGLALLGRRRMAGAPGSTGQDGSFLRYQAAVALVMAIVLGVAVGGVTNLTVGLHLDHLGGYLLQGLLFGAAISVVFGTVGVSDGSVPLAVPWTGRARRRLLAWRIMAAAVSFLFGYWLSRRTNIDYIEPDYVIPVLVGVTFGVAAWFVTGALRLTPSNLVRSNRRSMLRRLRRDFAWGLLMCFAIGLFFGLVFGTVGGAVAGWRAEMNDGFPAGSTVTTESDGTLVVKDRDRWKYTIALDGTKTAEPLNPVNGMLIVNSRGSGYIHDPPRNYYVWVAARSALDPKEGAKLCHDAPILRCFTKQVAAIRSAGGQVSIRFSDGETVEDGGLVLSVFQNVYYWFGQPAFQQFLLGGLWVGFIGGLTLGGVGGVACGLYRWLETPADITRSTSPLSSLKTDRVAALTRGVLITALSGLVCFIVFLVTSDVDGSHGIAGQLWLAIGPVAVCLSAWGRLLAARIWLGATGRLPWRLMTFLSDAHRRGVLRQSGALYQFRHLRLQQQLAADPRGARQQRERDKGEG